MNIRTLAADILDIIWQVRFTASTIYSSFGQRKVGSLDNLIGDLNSTITKLVEHEVDLQDLSEEIQADIEDLEVELAKTHDERKRTSRIIDKLSDLLS